MKISFWIVLFLIAPVAHVSDQAWGDQDKEFKVSVPFGKEYDYSRILVTRVIDGNTLQLENGERVRLIGLDAPENRDNSKARRDSVQDGIPLRLMKIRGRRSAKFVRDLAEGRIVRLEFDLAREDREGRLAAYVYIGEVFLNAEIIKQGYAAAFPVPPNLKYAGLFNDLWREAKEKKIGLWKDRKDEAPAEQGTAEFELPVPSVPLTNMTMPAAEEK